MKKPQDSSVFNANAIKRGLTRTRTLAASCMKACDPLRFLDTGSEKLLIIYANIRV